MSQKQKQRRWSAAEARLELDAWRRSGAPMARFARKRGYQGQRLAWWLKRLEPTADVAPAPVALAPAVVTDRGRTAAVVVAIEPASVRLEIDDASAVHPAWVAELVAALRVGAQLA